MSHTQSFKPSVSYAPCPPEEFSGRFNEKGALFEILQEAKQRGLVIMVSGARGSGKSSFLDWIEYEIQNQKGSPVIKDAFLETPGMILTTYRSLLTTLKEYQKFGWFHKAINNPVVSKSIDVALDVLEKFYPLAGPGTSAVRGLLPTAPVEYSQLVSSFLAAFHKVSTVVGENDQFLVVLCDDVQWSSGADFYLLKDLVRNVPSGIVLVVAFRLEAGNMGKYVELRQELDRFGHSEIRLSAMTPEEIKDLGARRFKLAVDDKTAHFLSMNIGDPLCLMSCFNLLEGRSLFPTLANVQKIAPEAVDPARCIYSGLDQEWKRRVDSLCILRPPLPLSLIGCMLDREKCSTAELQEELDESVVFRRLRKEVYDFAHPSVREYRRKELPESMVVELHTHAVRCLEALKGQFEESTYDFSLAEHLFFAQDYERALKLNLNLGALLYDHFDYSVAFEMTERAVECAEKTENRDALAGAFHQKGMILQSVFNFSGALDAYNQSLTIEREIGDRAGEARTLHQIGMVYQLKNKVENALNYYNQSLTIKREIGDRAGEARTLHQIGRVYQLKNQFDNALNYYNQSLTIEREIGDRASEASTLHQIGRVYQLKNKVEDALNYYNQSLTIEREIGDRAGEAQTLHQIGIVYQLKNQFEDALNYYNQSLTIEREIGDRAGEASTLHQIGRVYQLKNQFEDALNYYNQSLTIKREIGDRAGEASTLHQIGRVYEDTNKVENALNYYNQSLTIKREIGNKSGEMISLRTIKSLKEKMDAKNK